MSGEAPVGGEGTAQRAGTGASTETAPGEEPTTGPERGRRPRSRARVIAYTLLTMLLVVVLAAVGFGLYLDHLVSANVRHDPLLPPAESRAARAQGAGDAQNILLLGSDSRTEQLQDASRADVIQLVHISDDRSSVQVIHFPRDLYVPIPGHGRNKINAAYAFGGAPLLVQTMEGMLHVRIDHVAQIGFDGFRDLTNTVGGVDVNVDQPTTSDGHTFTRGINHLDGDAALAFVRERKQLSEGDIDRGRRQQAWLKGLLDKTLRAGTLANPVRLAHVVDDTTSNLVVDDGFSTGEMRSLALSLRNLRGGGVTFATAPFSGFRSVPGVGSVDVVDDAGMARLGTALREDRVADLPKTTSSPG
ncbi:LCP family protein [Luteipulveratus flavus]|uniref:LCP family protein n=1 Tax=Luteipulveratus flavus TaxID=3031728 RepID=A0ABT6C9H2_9MICO|nr:LCP family protein [Luteipulveratus sp. YIM 133296]MDF8265559.1 LCP family protein [Luteipulveratus sp. YIM 133296]